ncbi:microcephalin, partial [Rhinophrynus dorsalis]
GVTAYVEVWSSNRTENYSKSFTQQLLNLGAKVSKTFNKQVSHVVFKDGNRGTWDKAIKTGVKLVSVLWVEKCRETAAHVDESLFPAINTNEGLPQIIKKKRKCMQPKDFVEKTPENDKRMQRKFDKMSKELEMQKASIDVPVLLFDQDGALMYSPKALAADRSNAMEKRLKEMKNKRECISPTASQMSQLSDFAPLKPSLGCSPSFSRDSSHEEKYSSVSRSKLIKEVTSIKQAVSYFCDASLNIIQLAARASFLSVTARRALLLRSWGADTSSKNKLVALPFSAKMLFGEHLEEIVKTLTGGKSSFLKQEGRTRSSARQFDTNPEGRVTPENISQEGMIRKSNFMLKLPGEDSTVTLPINSVPKEIPNEVDKTRRFKVKLVTSVLKAILEKSFLTTIPVMVSYRKYLRFCMEDQHYQFRAQPFLSTEKLYLQSIQTTGLGPHHLESKEPAGIRMAGKPQEKSSNFISDYHLLGNDNRHLQGDGLSNGGKNFQNQVGENGSDDPDNSFEDLCGSQESKQNCSSISKTRRKHRNQKCIPDSTLEGNNDCVLNSSSKSIYLTPQRTEKFNLPKRLSGDEEKRRSDSLLKNKIHSFLHDIETVDGATENSNALCFTQITKKETTDLYDTPLKNRLFANCEEKRAKRARSSVKSKAFTSISCPSATRNTEQELTKPFTFSHSSDSAEAGSSFEDFFSSITVNRPKMQLSRFSLGALPQKSPSPPSLTSDKKCSSRKSRRSAEDVDAHGSSGNKRRRKTFHFTDNAESRQETAGPKNGDVKHNHLLKSEVAVSESDKSQTSLGICKKPDICLVKGLEKITHLVTCKKALGELELKDTKGDLKEMVLEKTEDPLKIIYKSAESKTSPCDARDGLSKMFNEQRNKCTEESRKKEKTRKSVRSLVMTSMCSEKQNAIIQVVKKFGGFVFSDHVCETTTHVIAGSPRRTLNIILGIARGCWILSYDWVLWSLEHGHWIPEEPYELSDHFPAALICRLQRHLSAGEYQQDLLSSLPTVFISPCSQPPCDKLSEVVQLCGGKVCKAVRQAKICIGEFTGKRPQDALNVSEKWLLDSVTQHKLHPFENYLLN